jgi:molybdate-binding protein
LPEGSERGLQRFVDREIVAAAIHLHSINDMDNDANVAAMRDRQNLHDAVLIAFARREQGLVVADGNPLKLKSIEDVAARRARMALRPKGAGAQLLLLSLLQRANTSLDRLVCMSSPCPTGPDIAQAIRAGRTDCGIATRSVANAAGLDFVPLIWERFDLVMRQRDYFRRPLQAFLDFLRSQALTMRAKELGGYDLAAAGEVRYAP